MIFSKRLFGIFLLLLFIILVFIFYPYKYKLERKIDRSFALPTLSLDQPFDAKIVFLGDSITEYLGNFEDLRNFLLKSYPNKRILLLNYGYSSTNILSALDRIEKDTTHSGRIFEPINNISYNLIFIESFGYNPLSHYSLEEGLKKQTEELDKIFKTLSEKHPTSKIIFWASLAPDKTRFGQGSLNLTPEKRVQWASERRSYIENHISYANAHNIPLLDIYHNSQNVLGESANIFISETDHIHPSPVGVYFISKSIAEFIQDQKLLP